MKDLLKVVEFYRLSEEYPIILKIVIHDLNGKRKNLLVRSKGWPSFPSHPFLPEFLGDLIELISVCNITMNTTRH